MGTLTERGGLRDATASEFRNKAILLDVTYYADPQAVGHMRAGGADRDELAASKSETRKRNHCARSGQVVFDERSCTLAALVVESYARLGKDGSYLIDHAAAGIVGVTDRESLAWKGFCKERLLQVILVTSQVVISR